MFRDGSSHHSDPLDEVTSRSLHRIAAVLGISVRSFFGPAPVGKDGSAPRSRTEQVDALMRLFDQITDPEARERIITFVEAELAALATNR